MFLHNLVNLTVILAIILINSLISTKFVDSAKEAHWAVLVAGSKGFPNYRHQSDICHAYQILRRNGLPANRIITLSYDDVADSWFNPFRGKLFNKPDPKGKGIDNYEGCIIDYNGYDNNPTNFLNIIQGKEMTVGSKRTLESNSDDNVFIYFADHGGSGLIAFPDTLLKNNFLWAPDLDNALINMNKLKKYKKLVFYLEACESGSMFPTLPNDINIYVTTAANATESSWGTYCRPNDMVDGKHIHVCLGDDYSVRWMEDSENQNMKKAESLEKQFETVRNGCSRSHPLQFGDKSFDNESIADYQAYNLTEKFKPLNFTDEYLNYLEEAKLSVVDSRDNTLHFLYNRVMYANDLESVELLKIEIAQRKKIDEIFANFNFNLNSPPIIDFQCLKTTVDNFINECMDISDYGLKYVKYMAKLCETKTQDEIMEMFIKICKKKDI